MPMSGSDVKFRQELEDLGNVVRCAHIAERALDIAFTVAALRRQGVEPIAEFFGIADLYVAGDFNLDQFIAAVEGLRSRRRPN